MKKARLVKQKDLVKHEQTKPTSLAQSTVVSKTMDVVKEWIKEHQLTKGLNSKEAFAALFVRPQTD
jgi:hypothetical protein